MYMVSPNRVISDASGKVTGIEMIRELGAPDAKDGDVPSRRPAPGSPSGATWC